MKSIATDLPGVLIIEPVVYGDNRGFFMESYHRHKFAALGIDAEFCQDNISSSVQHTIRGLHYQYPRTQGKLVLVVQGCVLDVALDIRRGSPTFGRWFGAELSATNHRQMWIPPGFAHGFCVLSPEALIAYKCTDVYVPTDERTVLWNDPEIGISWPCGQPILSTKDTAGVRLRDIPAESLPTFV